MNTLEYILKKFNIDASKERMPFNIPNYGRNNLAELFQEVGFKAGAEIGVGDGRYSEILCLKNPKLNLYCVDLWRPYDEFRDIVDKKVFETLYSISNERLSKYGCHLIKNFSCEAVKDFKDGELDFVYIDGNHEYKYVIDDITQWSKKVRSGGIIGGHDYADAKYCDVIRAVNDYTKANNINPWFVLGLKSKPSDKSIIRDIRRSWMWVKE